MPLLTPLVVAVVDGDVEALEWLIQRFFNDSRIVDRGLSFKAAKHAKIENLKVDVLAANARWQDREVLQWAHENGCRWNERTCSNGRRMEATWRC